MKKNKVSLKPLIFILLLPIIFAGLFVTLYYTSEVVVVNKFKSSTYDVSLVDSKPDTWGERRVSIKNKDGANTPVVLRVNYNEAFTKKDKDYLLVVSNNINGEDVSIKKWTDAFKNDFVKGEDGWYYYKKVLKGNSDVEILEGVTLNEELIKKSTEYKKYKTYDYDLSFNYEAIQATDEAIYKIWNRKVVIDDDKVKWDV